MNPSQLRETVMDPETRQLVRLSISSTDNANANDGLTFIKRMLQQEKNG